MRLRRDAEQVNASFIINRKDYDRFKRVAEGTGRSFSSAVRMAIADWIRKEERAEDNAEQ